MGVTRCLACDAELDPASGRCPTCDPRRELLASPTEAGQTAHLTSTVAPVVARACWIGLPYHLRMIWHERVGATSRRDLERYLEKDASPVSLALARRDGDLPVEMRVRAAARLDVMGLSAADLRRLLRHFQRLLRMSRDRLLKHLSVPRKAARGLDRVDLLAEVAAVRELQQDVRAERPLARAFRAMFRTRRPTALWAVVGATLALFFVFDRLEPFQRLTLVSEAALWPSLEKPWTLLTYGFLHGSWSHVGLNMLALVLVGKVSEHVLGHLGFLAVYVAGTLGGGLASVAYKSMEGIALPTVGASGAVTAVAAMALFLGIWFELRYGRVPLRYAGGTLTAGLILVSGAVIGAVQGDPMVDHAAHFGGLVVGITAGVMLRPRLRARADERFRMRSVVSLSDLAGRPKGLASTPRPVA